MNMIHLYIDSKAVAINANDAILKAIERNYNCFVKEIHDEAKGYAILNHKNEWQVVPFDIVNECAGLGFVNHCLLNY